MCQHAASRHDSWAALLAPSPGPSRPSCTRPGSAESGRRGRRVASPVQGEAASKTWLSSLPEAPPPPTEAEGACRLADGTTACSAPGLPQKSRWPLEALPPARIRAAAGPGAEAGPRGARPERSGAARGGGAARESQGGGGSRRLGAVVRCHPLPPPPCDRERKRTTKPRVPREPRPAQIVQHVVRLTRPAPAPPAAPRPAAALPLPSLRTAGQRGRGVAALPRPARPGGGEAVLGPTAVAAGACKGERMAGVVVLPVPRSRGGGYERRGRVPSLLALGRHRPLPLQVLARRCCRAAPAWAGRWPGRGGPTRSRCWKRSPGLGRELQPGLVRRCPAGDPTGGGAEGPLRAGAASRRAGELRLGAGGLRRSAPLAGLEEARRPLPASSRGCPARRPALPCPALPAEELRLGRKLVGQRDSWGRL